MRTFVFFTVALIFILIMLIPKAVLAEIVTTKDWIGLFSTNASQNCSSDDDTISCRNKTVNGTSWGYPSNKNAAGVCAQTPGTTPIISDPAGCRFTPNPFPLGTYEFRMYAYDRGDPDALIAESATMTVGVGATAGGGDGVPCPDHQTAPRVRDGLISAPTVGNNFGNNLGQCASGDQASFAPYKIPSYEDLKSKYYIQSKAYKDPTNLTSITSSTNLGTANALYSASGNLTVSGNPTGTGTQVIFVTGDLSFTSTGNYCYGSATCPAGAVNGTTGTVFVVSGAVHIDPAVTRIDAVIIARGIIYTASTGAGCSLPPPATPGTNNQLVVNGSLVSLDPGSIIFCRKLTSDINPAEVINNQPKYLVILRDMMSDTLQKWSEIQ